MYWFFMDKNDLFMKKILLLILLFSFYHCQNVDESLENNSTEKTKIETINETSIFVDEGISKDSSYFVAWATGYTDVNYGLDVDVQWQTPSKALGQAQGISSDIVSLGNGGDITLTFNTSISNKAGADFAVFENSFSETFLELAYVEVSSDGIHFVRFDNESLTTEMVSAYGFVDPSKIKGLAGKYKLGLGTPFDLDKLSNKPLVLNHTVDVNHISYIRIVDIVGCDDTTSPACSTYTSSLGYPFLDQF